MRCSSPRTVGFKADGKTLAWSQRDFNKEYATFQLPCGKCLECRLEYASQWAIRCVHEAQMHEKNAFITLTYSDEFLPGPKLVYADFQKFMKRLRHKLDAPLGVFVTGEYGEKNKRPHWHCIVFGWCPPDGMHEYTNERGDRIYTSDVLNKLWGKGKCDFGSVTLESAGYCARYSAKKIVHGPNQKVCEADFHDFQPISKKSSKNAIGKKWIEKFWPDVFQYGRLVLPSGETAPIPRYYEKWFKENHPEKFLEYISKRKCAISEEARLRALASEIEWLEINALRREQGKLSFTLTERQKRKLITETKFKMLQDYLKL